VTVTRTALPAGYGALHDSARATLSRWTAPDDRQERQRQDFLAHLDAHPDAMWRHGPAAHLTASALVLNPALDRALLTHHGKAGLWVQFGGHFEAEDDSVHAAATREAREESGVVALELAPRLVQLDRHTLGAGFGRCREHLDMRYAGVVPDEAAYAVSAESLDVRWWPVDGLPDGSAELLPLVAAARAVLAR
jgi:8-oxo-dGTP pyrophosphatase MutT (NUDIX family)